MCTTKEVLFAQRLADNEKTVRDRTLKKLKKYLAIKSSRSPGITEDEALRLWKGLFYCMYMADKPLIQESLAENISALIHSLQSRASKLSFIKAGFLTFAREWNGIDVFRINKYMMLVRRFLRQVFVFLQKCNWNLKIVTSVASVLEESVVKPSDDINVIPLDLKLHVCSIFLEELAKVGGEQLDHKVIMALLQQYFKVLALTKIVVYCNSVKENVIRHLMRQSSVGQEVECYDEEEEVEMGEEEMEEENAAVAEMRSHAEGMERKSDETADVLDPRAGLVDVCIPQLMPDYNLLADALETIGKTKQIRKSKKILLNQLASELRDVGKGVYPLAPKASAIDDDDDDGVSKDEVENAVKRLQKFEEKVKEGQKIEDSDDDSGVDLGPTKREVQSMRKLSALKKKKQKQKAAKKKRKLVGKAEKRKMNRQQEKKTLRQVEGVENMLHVVRSAAGIPNPLTTDKKLDNIATGVNGFNVSPMLKRKMETRNIFTTAGFSVETMKSRKKKSNDSVEPPKKKKKNNSSFTESALQIPHTGHNNVSEKVTTNQKSLTDDSQVAKLSQGMNKSSNVPVVSENQVSSYINGSKEVVDISKEGKSCQSKSKERNLVPEVTHAEKQLQKKNKIASKTKEIDLVPEVAQAEKQLQKKNKISSKTKERNLVPEVAHTEKQLQKKDTFITSQPEKTSLTPCNTSQNQSQKKKIAATVSEIPREEKLVINFSDTNEQKGLKNIPVNGKGWEEPLKKGEFEIVIKSRKLINREKKKGVIQHKKNLLKNYGGKARTININLKRNQTHEFSDYMRTIKASPSIPFSADLKPRAPAIKRKGSTVVASTASPLLKILKRKKGKRVGIRVVG